MQWVVGRFDQTFTIQLSGRARLYNTPLYNSFKDFEGTSVNENVDRSIQFAPARYFHAFKHSHSQKHKQPDKR